MSSNKPMPTPTDISAAYWEGLKQGKLLIQHCTDCGHWIFFPRRHCDRCWSHAVETREVSGGGVLYTYTLTRIPTLPDFADEMPQALAVVQLDEGVRINCTLIGVDPSAIRVGMRVRPVFDTVNATGATLLRFTAEGSDMPARIDTSPQAAAAAAEAAQAAGEARQVSKVDFGDEEAMSALVSDEYTDWSNQIVIDQGPDQRVCQVVPVTTTGFIPSRAGAQAKSVWRHDCPWRTGSGPAVAPAVALAVRGDGLFQHGQLRFRPPALPVAGSGRVAGACPGAGEVGRETGARYPADAGSVHPCGWRRASVGDQRSGHSVYVVSSPEGLLCGHFAGFLCLCSAFCRRLVRRFFLPVFPPAGPSRQGCIRSLNGR